MVQPIETIAMSLYIEQGTLSDSDKYGYQKSVAPELIFGSLNPNDWKKTGKYKGLYVWNLYGTGTETIDMGFNYLGNNQISEFASIDLTFEPVEECSTPMSVTLTYDDTSGAYLGTNASIVNYLKSHLKGVVKVIADINYV